MAYSVLVDTEAASTTGNGVTTGSIDTTGANLIVISVANFGGTPVVSDSKGNTWTALTASNTGSTTSRLHYCYNPTVGSGHTFTVTGTTSYPSIGVVAVSGAAASPFDQQNGAAQASGTTLATGSVTPTEDNEFFYTATSDGNIAAAFSSINSGFTSLGAVPASGTANGLAHAYKIQTTGGAENPTWTYAVGQTELATRIATFKAAAAGGATIFDWLRQPSELSYAETAVVPY